MLNVRCSQFSPFLKADSARSAPLRAGGHIVAGESREKPFELLFAGQICRQRAEKSAIAFEPAAVTLLRAQRKMLPADNVYQLDNGLGGIHAQSLIHEPVVRISKI